CIILSVAVDYNQRAFETPRYEGMLEAAPWLLDILDKGFTQVDDLGRRLELVAGNLNRVMGQVDQLEPLARADGALKVIQVSDIHNNSAAYELLSRVVQGFGADLIIDTGDITDFGTPLETQLAGRLEELKIPYYFIPGNHETAEAIARLRRIRGVRVLDGESVSYKGLSILGLGDPAAQTEKLAATPKQLQQSSDRLYDIWSKMRVAPDLVAVHNVMTARKLLGKIPVLLHGHDHQAKIYEKGKTWLIDAGSTGAEGMRGLESQSKDGSPYSLALLRFDRAPTSSGHQYQLTVVDLIKVYSINGRFVLERKVLKGGDGDPDLSSSLALPRATRKDSGLYRKAEAR
ncbi:MAG TPA: metallophosphoesterase, partial [Bacillota bacterium]|nr:metallophosphoesterase [Bacillota bacterium]